MGQMGHKIVGWGLAILWLLPLGSLRHPLCVHIVPPTPRQQHRFVGPRARAPAMVPAAARGTLVHLQRQGNPPRPARVKRRLRLGLSLVLSLAATSHAVAGSGGRLHRRALAYSISSTVSMSMFKALRKARPVARVAAMRMKCCFMGAAWTLAGVASPISVKLRPSPNRATHWHTATSGVTVTIVVARSTRPRSWANATRPFTYT